MPNVEHTSALRLHCVRLSKSMLSVLRRAVVAGMAPQLCNGCCVAPEWRLAGLLYQAKLNFSHIHIYYKYICIFAAISYVNAP